MVAATLKKQAHELVEALPDDSDWEELIDRLQVRLAIERGRADVRAGRFIDQDELERELERR